MNNAEKIPFKLINIFVLITIVCVFAVGIAGCTKEGSKMTSGDFVYCYINGTSSNFRTPDGENVAILTLSESGRQKEVLVIPDYIDGKPVVQIGMSGLGWGYTLGSVKGKKLYLPSTIVTIDSNLAIPSGLVFLKDLTDIGYLERKAGVTYLSQSLYNKFISVYGIDSVRGNLHVANVTFMSEEETYWIDNCYDNDKLIAPIQPVREGYLFAGWYKDTTFLNEWNFETDTFETDLANPSMVLQAKWLLV